MASNAPKDETGDNQFFGVSTFSKRSNSFGLDTLKKLSPFHTSPRTKLQPPPENDVTLQQSPRPRRLSMSFGPTRKSGGAAGGVIPLQVHVNTTTVCEVILIPGDVIVSGVIDYVESKFGVKLDHKYTLRKKSGKFVARDRTIDTLKSKELWIVPPVRSILRLDDRHRETFGIPVEEIQSLSRNGLPLALQQSFSFLEKSSQRTSEGASDILAAFVDASPLEQTMIQQVHNLRQRFDDGVEFDFPESTDCAIIVTLVQQFFQQLPDSITTVHLRDRFLKTAPSNQDVEQGARPSIKEIFQAGASSDNTHGHVGELAHLVQNDVPQVNYIIVEAFMRLLHDLWKKSSVSIDILGESVSGLLFQKNSLTPTRERKSMAEVTALLIQYFNEIFNAETTRQTKEKVLEKVRTDDAQMDVSGSHRRLFEGLEKKLDEAIRTRDDTSRQQQLQRIQELEKQVLAHSVELGEASKQKATMRDEIVRLQDLAVQLQAQLTLTTAKSPEAGLEGSEQMGVLESLQSELERVKGMFVRSTREHVKMMDVMKSEECRKDSQIMDLNANVARLLADIEKQSRDFEQQLCEERTRALEKTRHAETAQTTLQIERDRNARVESRLAEKLSAAISTIREKGSLVEKAGETLQQLQDEHQLILAQICTQNSAAIEEERQKSREAHALRDETLQKWDQFQTESALKEQQSQLQHQNDIEQLNKIMTQVEAQTTELQQELSEKGNLLLESQAREQVLEQEVSKQNSELMLATQLVQEESSRVSDLTAKLEQLQKSFDDINSALETNIHDQREQELHDTQEIEALHNQISLLNDQVAKLQNHVGNLEQDNLHLRMEQESMLSQRVSAEEELKGILEEQRQDRERLQRDLDEQHQENENLRNALDEKNHNVIEPPPPPPQPLPPQSAQDIDKSSLEERLAQKDRDFAALQSEILGLQNELKSVLDRTAAIQADRDEILLAMEATVEGKDQMMRHYEDILAGKMSEPIPSENFTIIPLLQSPPSSPIGEGHRRQLCVTLLSGSSLRVGSRIPNPYVIFRWTLTHDGSVRAAALAGFSATSSWKPGTGDPVWNEEFKLTVPPVGEFVGSRGQIAEPVLFIEVLSKSTGAFKWWDVLLGRAKLRLSDIQDDDSVMTVRLERSKNSPKEPYAGSLSMKVTTE